MENNSKTYTDLLFNGKQEIVNRLKEQLKKVCTTRLHPDLISNIKVVAYEEESPLKNIANIQLITGRSFSIKSFDPSLNVEIEKAIRKYNPTFNPIIANNTITLSFPSPTEDSRKQSVKDVKAIVENSKINLRNLRKSVIEKIKKDDLPEDEEKKLVTLIEQEIKKNNLELEELFKGKEKELLTI